MKELILSITKKDFKITYFSGKGAGGQHRNKHQNCVRLTHIESNITKTGQSSKSRSQNLKEAFRTLTKCGEFKVWHNRKINEILRGKKIEEDVEDMMLPINLKIECKDSDIWKEINES